MTLFFPSSPSSYTQNKHIISIIPYRSCTWYRSKHHDVVFCVYTHPRFVNHVLHIGISIEPLLLPRCLLPLMVWVSGFGGWEVDEDEEGRGMMVLIIFFLFSRSVLWLGSVVFMLSVFLFSDLDCGRWIRFVYGFWSFHYKLAIMNSICFWVLIFFLS